MLKAATNAETRNGIYTRPNLPGWRARRFAVRRGIMTAKVSLRGFPEKKFAATTTQPIHAYIPSLSLSLSDSADPEARIEAAQPRGRSPLVVLVVF